MKKSLQEALKNTDTAYDQLVEIANDIVKEYVENVNKVINTISSIENMNNDLIRDTIIKLSIASFRLGDVKEKSALRAECAEALRKEAYAVEFNSFDGSVASKDSSATLNVSSEIMVESIHNLVASLLKTKLDETHRIVDTLKTVLMSRLQEAKLNTNISVD